MTNAGYQSDFRSDNIRGDQNIPRENSIGGFGVTSGEDDNVYELVLAPPLTRSYVIGLSLEVGFDRSNTDVATLNVDGQGTVALKKFNGTSLVPLDTGDLKDTLIYTLVFDGDCFQVLTGIAIPSGVSQNRQEVFSILDENINAVDVFYVNNRNRYAIVNDNLVIPQNIRLRRVGGAGAIGGASGGGVVLKMPLASDVGGVIAWTTQSSEGNFFLCQLSGLGVLSIEGIFGSELDEVSIHFPSYLAKTPIEIPETPIF